MLYLGKGQFQKVVRWMAGSWMTANMATVFGCVFIALAAAGFYLGLSVPPLRFLLLCVPLFLVMRMAMNALDGLLAREYKTGTVAGEIWNEALDVLGDTVCYGVLYFVDGGPRLSLAVFLLTIWAAEFFGVLGKSMPNGVRRHETVLGGKPDRAVWMSGLALLLFFRPSFLSYTHVYLGIVSGFVVLTSLIRIRKTITVARGREYQSYTWIGR
ncbi:MAG TPA: CDP-alcohol phosphatidyltransferase family protein [Thermoguttaceae bacterium]|nr:CDP-alcohol phosphatidyltransferase family protein [Thermoguttaceae bacterium]